MVDVKVNVKKRNGFWVEGEGRLVCFVAGTDKERTDQQARRVEPGSRHSQGTEEGGKPTGWEPA